MTVDQAMTPRTTLAPGAPWPIWHGQLPRAAVHPILSRDGRIERAERFAALLDSGTFTQAQVAAVFGTSPGVTYDVLNRLIARGRARRTNDLERCRDRHIPILYTGARK